MRNNIRVLTAGLITVGLVIYGRALLNGFVGDDPGYINHPYIQQFAVFKLFSGSSTDLGGTAPITGQFFRPIMLLIISQIHQLAGNSPWIYHLVQLLLHIANAVLVFLLLIKFSPIRTAYILSLVFLVHPINSETVVYLSNLQDILFVFFGLTAVNLTVYKKDPLMTGVCLLLSLLSKETGILFLFAVWGYGLVDRSINKTRLTGLIFCAGLVYAGLRWGVAGVGMGGVPDTLMGSLHLEERIAQIPAILRYYLTTILWPIKLAIGQTWIVRPELPIFIPVLTAIAIATIAAAVKMLKNGNKIGVYFLVWLGLGMILHLQIVPLEMTVADRWMYFPFIGLIGLIGHTGPVMGKRVMVPALLIVLLLGIRSFVRSGDFKDAAALYRHDTQVTESYLLEQAYGFELMQKNDFYEAQLRLEKSIWLYENAVNTNSLGVLYFRNNQTDKAIEWFEKSTALGDNFQAYNNLGRLLLSEKSPDQAMPVIKAGTEKFPKSDNFWFLTALAEYKRGNIAAALTAARKAAELSPSEQNIYILSQLQKGQKILIND